MIENFVYASKTCGKISFSIREDHTLAVAISARGKDFQLIFHDCVTREKKRFFLFHDKTEMRAEGNTVILRAAAVSEADGAPIRGLLVNYRFTFDEKAAAFYLSADYGCDAPLYGYTAKLMDVSWEGLEVSHYTGYEYDAEGKPFIKTFSVGEKNPEALSYDELRSTRGPEKLERTKTRPRAFRHALELEGERGGFAIFGSHPLYNVEAEYVSVFPNMAEFNVDLSYFSDANSLGAWFVLEKRTDMWGLFSELENRRPRLPVRGIPFVKREVAVRSGNLKMKLAQTESGVFTVCDGAQAAPLFYVSFRDNRYRRTVAMDSGAGWDKIDIVERKNYVRVCLSDPDNGRISGISVIAEAVAEPALDRITWTMKVVNRSDRWSVTDVSYPQCMVKGCDTAFVTTDSGVLLRDFNRTSSVHCGRYPTGVKAPMAFAAVYNSEGRGVYMGVHDADGNYKAVYLIGSAQSDCTLLGANCQATYGRHAGNSFTLPGKLVLQAFGGDWFDAVQIYKSFVHTEAAWFPRLRGRHDSPQWIREMPVWIMHFMPNDNPDSQPTPITLRDKYPDVDERDWYRKAIRFRREIGVPVAYHVYNWHWVPFNNDNPHYFPAHRDFKEGVEAMKKEDIRIIPYVSGYSWDEHDNREKDFRFAAEALPNTAKNAAGDVIANSHATNEPDGSPVRFARMCPTTAFWKDELRYLCRKLREDYSVDGIYLDVVSAAYNCCFDDTHLHAPGFGSYWWRAYAELLAGLRADLPEDFALVSESVSEVYAAALDGYLAWTWVQPDIVPAFPAVYGGRTALFGRVITLDKRDDADYFRFQTAQALMYGQQLGWIHPEIVDDKEQFPFLKKMAQLRYRFAEFFAEAEMLRPPMVDGKMALLDTEPFLRGKYLNHEKTVVASAWEDVSGERCLFVVNSGKEKAEVELSFPEKEYRFINAPMDLSDSDGATLISRETDGSVGKLRTHLDACGYAVFRWRI